MGNQVFRLGKKKISEKFYSFDKCPENEAEFIGLVRPSEIILYQNPHWRTFQAPTFTSRNFLEKFCGPLEKVAFYWDNFFFIFFEDLEQFEL
jgi:hypothetical protein